MMSIIAIKLPQLITVDDYHEFKNIVETLGELSGNKSISYEEIGCDGIYYGVLYQKCQKPTELIKELKKAYSKYEEDENFGWNPDEIMLSYSNE